MRINIRFTFFFLLHFHLYKSHFQVLIRLYLKKIQFSLFDKGVSVDTVFIIILKGVQRMLR
jgi:hypothetical protein